MYLLSLRISVLLTIIAIINKVSQQCEEAKTNTNLDHVATIQKKKTIEGAVVEELFKY